MFINDLFKTLFLRHPSFLRLTSTQDKILANVLKNQNMKKFSLTI